jgi:hypothetical protein
LLYKQIQYVLSLLNQVYVRIVLFMHFS